ncbi:NADH-quinone oxidoreductase subunit NuoE [Buchnera aphidicola (Mindarus keteleerifoliae)]|uniref:NADH-quinone oxidoreductase subunit NuoE n=1 Tax=Buchnera aphidicola TaxID=9 RepID=UPI0031B7116A
MKKKYLDIVLTMEEQKRIFEEKKKYEYPQAAVIEALKIAQEKRKWISKDVIYAISEILSIPSVYVQEVATFYSQIFLEPVGRNVIRYCDSVVCYVVGYKKILSILEKYLKIKPGQTTIDNKFTLLPICCLGCCDRAPSMMVNEDTYFNLSDKKIVSILESYL